MKILCDAIQNRYSCRSFDNSKCVSHDIIKSIIKAGSLAPSGKNTQPWRFRIIENKSIISSIAKMLILDMMIKKTVWLLVLVLKT